MVHRTKLKSFLARYPVIKDVVSTRIGNSSGGTTETNAGVLQGGHIGFPGGAPMRLAIPLAVSRVGLEYAPDRKTFLIRIHSDWNEGGWHDTYVDPHTGQVVGGLFDMPFPRTDLKNRTPENAYKFATGLWLWNGFKGIPGGTKKVPDWYRGEVPFKELKRGQKIGDESGVPGYSWKSDDSGFVLKTPKFTAYSLVSIGSAVTDPANPNLVFTMMNSHIMDWSYKGAGKEHRSWKPSYDFKKYPTDPRKGGGGHQQPIAAVRVNGTLYVYTSNTDINIYRWDEAARILVPVAGAAFRPDTAAARVPTPPKIEWGKGLIARTDRTGNFTADRYQAFDLSKLSVLRDGNQINVHPLTGDLWFLPAGTGIIASPKALIWKTFDRERGVLLLDNITEITLPTALSDPMTARECVQMRIHWATGDLYAIIDRNGVYCLERYAGWQKNPDVKPLYSVGPVALSVRRKFEWWSPYDKETGAPYDPKQGFMVASHGTMAVCGEYAFLVEGQSQGIRVHRLSDGAYVGRYFDRAHQNSSQDDPNGISVTVTATEYRVFVMDFHGKSTLVRRIPKVSLLKAAAVATARTNK